MKKILKIALISTSVLCLAGASLAQASIEDGVFSIKAVQESDSSIVGIAGIGTSSSSENNPGGGDPGDDSGGEVMPSLPEEENEHNRFTFILNDDASMPGCNISTARLVSVTNGNARVTAPDGTVKSLFGYNLNTNQVGKWTIEGTFDSLRFGTNDCLEEVVEWGEGTGTKSAKSMFSSVDNLKSLPKVIPTTIEDMSSMFLTSSFNGDIGSWNVANVKDMTSMFHGAKEFNRDISKWDTGNVTNMSKMFSGATSFNQDVSDWNLSNVQNMTQMFYQATNFNNGNRPLSWSDLSSVTDMQQIFSSATNFNQRVDTWNTPKVRMLYSAFLNATSFNQDISNWDISSATNTENMFYGATAFNNGGQPLNWGAKVGNVTNMNSMFREASAFDQNITNWDVSSVTNMNSMFRDATSFNNGGEPLSWGEKTSSLRDMGKMFSGATNFDQDISDWNVDNVIRAFAPKEYFVGSGLENKKAFWPKF